MPSLYLRIEWFWSVSVLFSYMTAIAHLYSIRYGTTFIVSGVLSVPTILFGLCGCIYTTVVPRARARRSKLSKAQSTQTSCATNMAAVSVGSGVGGFGRFYTYLQWLGACDAAFLVSTLFFYPITVIVYGDKVLTGPPVYGYLWMLPVAQTCMSASVLTTVALSIERLLVVARPLRRPTVPVNRLCAGIALAAVCMVTPVWAEFAVVPCVVNGTQTSVSITDGPVRGSVLYQLYYRTVTLSGLCGLLPTLCVGMLSALTEYYRRSATITRETKLRSHQVYRITGKSAIKLKSGAVPIEKEAFSDVVMTSEPNANSDGPVRRSRCTVVNNAFTEKTHLPCLGMVADL